MTGESPYAVRSVLRVLDILALLRRRAEGASLSEVTTATDMPKSSVFRYLSTLESRGYVERNGANNIYRLGAAFLSSDAQHLELLASRARPVLEELRDRFEETVNLGVLDGTRIVYLEIVESRQAMRFVSRKGDREPLHSTALGKAVSILLDDDDIRAILAAEGMPARTGRTITDPDEFIARLQQIRQSGYAIDDRENEEYGRCVAVPVTGVGFPAAISLSAPAARLSEAEALAAAQVLAEAAAVIGGEPT